MAYKIWLFLWYFVLASFCGWVAEVGYIGMVYRKFKNPGMLNGPYCPQYGLMIALPWAALTALHWQTSFVATLFFCLISSFLVEFTFAWLLRKTTHIRLRDYSKFKWNIKGYVSVPVATVRGVCFSFIVVFIVPVLTSLLHYVNRTVGWVILYAVLGIMLLDIIITSITVQRLNHQFKRLSELGDRVREARNALGNAVTGGAIGAAEAIDDLDLQKKLQEAPKTADENYTALVYGPFQPIYGGGAAIITLCLYKLYKQDDIIIFVASGIIGAAFEYLCSWGQEMLFGTVSWDYSGTPFNIDGRTNLMFALIWGTLGLIWIKEIYPAMSRMIEKIPKRPGAILTILLVAFMLFDGLISCAALTRANERAEGIPATSSFQMFLDKHLDDNYLALVYPNMQKVNEDGTKSEPLKDTVKNT